jgi:hypothetical protein
MPSVPKSFFMSYVSPLRLLLLPGLPKCLLQVGHEYFVLLPYPRQSVKEFHQPRRQAHSRETVQRLAKALQAAPMRDSTESVEER